MFYFILEISNTKILKKFLKFIFKKTLEYNILIIKNPIKTKNIHVHLHVIQETCFKNNIRMKILMHNVIWQITNLEHHMGKNSAAWVNIQKTSPKFCTLKIFLKKTNLLPRISITKECLFQEQLISVC